jgi:hypothetical protein
MSLYLSHTHWIILKFNHFTVNENIFNNVKILSWYFENIFTTDTQISTDSIKNDSLLADLQRSIFPNSVYFLEPFFNLIQRIYSRITIRYLGWMVIINGDIYFNFIFMMKTVFPWMNNFGINSFLFSKYILINNLRLTNYFVVDSKFRMLKFRFCTLMLFRIWLNVK